MTLARFCLLALVLWLIPESLFGAAIDSADVRVRNTYADAGALSAQFALVGGGNQETQFKFTSPLLPGPITNQVKMLPINLWVIVDTSQLCATHHVDQALASQLATLKRQLPAESLLSVVSFTNATLEVQENHQSIRAIGDSDIHCDAHLLSNSYERAISKLLDAKMGLGLPTIAWVYSSGNVQLSDTILNRLAERKVSVEVILYNSILSEELRPLIEKQNARNGGERFHLLAFDKISGDLPERWYQATLTPPQTFNAGSFPLVVTAFSGANPIANTSTMVAGYRGSSPSWWSKYQGWVGLAFGLIILSLGLCKIIYYYWPHRCRHCRRRLRAAKAVCLFCLSEDTAYLVGDFNWRDRLKFKHVDVLPLEKPHSEIGTHRQSQLRLVKPQGVKPGKYFHIERHKGPTGRTSYCMVPAREQFVRVNGKPQTAARYLAPGDRIETKGWCFRFIIRRTA